MAPPTRAWPRPVALDAAGRHSPRAAGGAAGIGFRGSARSAEAPAARRRGRFQPCPLQVCHQAVPTARVRSPRLPPAGVLTPLEPVSGSGWVRALLAGRSRVSSVRRRPCRTAAFYRAVLRSTAALGRRTGDRRFPRVRGTDSGRGPVLCGLSGAEDKPGCAPWNGQQLQFYPSEGRAAPALGLCTGRGRCSAGDAAAAGPGPAPGPPSSARPGQSALILEIKGTRQSSIN